MTSRTCSKYIVAFKGVDAYNNLTFISSPEIDEKSYTKLKKLSTKISQNYPDIFTPVFHSVHNFCSVRTLKTTGKLKPRSIYKVEFNIIKKLKKKDNSPYLVLGIIGTPEFVKDREIVGEIINL